jgi:hypothetical protein
MSQSSNNHIHLKCPFCSSPIESDCLDEAERRRQGISSDEMYVVCPRCGFIDKFYVESLIKYDKENPSKR